MVNDLNGRKLIDYGTLPNGRHWFALEYKDYSIEYIVTTGPVPMFSLGVLDGKQLEDLDKGMTHQAQVQELLGIF